jgi:hypothetical protein
VGVDVGEISGFWICAGTNVRDHNVLEDPTSGRHHFAGVPVEPVASVPLCPPPGDSGRGFVLFCASHWYPAV